MWRRVLNSRLWISVGVVVILAAALIGGSILVQKRGEQARARGAEVAVQQQKNSENSDNSHSQTSSNSSQSSSGQTGSSDTTATGSANSNSAESTPVTGQLPQTGPSDFLGTALVLAMLTFSAVLYLRSRQANTSRSLT